MVSTTLGQLSAWRRLEPTPRVSRLNTREKPTSLYTLLYRLSATTRGNTETDKTKQGETHQGKQEKRKNKKRRRKGKKQERALMGIIQRTLETGVGCAASSRACRSSVFLRSSSRQLAMNRTAPVPLYTSTPGHYTPPVTNPLTGYRTLSGLP